MALTDKHFYTDKVLAILYKIFFSEPFFCVIGICLIGRCRSLKIIVLN